MSEDEANNEVIYTSGQIDMERKYSHIDLCAFINGYDSVRGSKVMGSRGYFLTVFLCLILY